MLRLDAEIRELPDLAMACVSPNDDLAGGQRVNKQ
jgi:hypothetical protein